MIDQLQALITLSQEGTMSQAAARLGVTQSAVSKRLSSLEKTTGKQIFELQGRKTTLTPFGLHLVQRSQPLIAELRDVFREEIAETWGVISLVVDQSIMIAWGADTLWRVSEKLKKESTIDIRVQRGLITTELVRSGEAMLAICPGYCPTADLEGDVFLEEPMVIVPSRLQPFSLREQREVGVMTVKKHSETWQAIEPRLKRESRKHGFRL
ncbi:LysR family transcriptional regulator [bacterium]|nr:LysR family transcriptional regulator [bacterium]